MIDESLSGLASRFFFRETGKAEVAGVLERGIAITRVADGGGGRWSKTSKCLAVP
jgi:hypothetical protein